MPESGWQRLFNDSGHRKIAAGTPCQSICSGLFDGRQQWDNVQLCLDGPGTNLAMPPCRCRVGRHRPGADASRLRRLCTLNSLLACKSTEHCQQLACTMTFQNWTQRQYLAIRSVAVCCILQWQLCVYCYSCLSVQHVLVLLFGLVFFCSCSSL